MSDSKRGIGELNAEIESLKAAYADLESKFRENENNYKKVEQALRYSERQSRALVEAIPDMMFRMSSDGVYLDYKAASEDLYFQSESIIGKNNHDITPPDFAELVERKIKETLQTGAVQVFEYQLKIKDNPGVSEYEARMVPDGANEIIAIVRNITHRKKAERALRESVTNARAIIDASSDILCLLNKDGKVIDCNQALSACFGMNPQDMTGKCIFDFLPEEENRVRKQYFSKVFKKGKPVTGETTISGRTADYSIYPVKDETGAVSKVAVYAFDSTEQKAARRALIESEEIFNSFMENSPIYVFFKDEQIRASRLSKNYEKMLGLPIDLMKGKTMHELFPSALADKMVKDDLSVLAEGKPLKIEEELDGRFYNTIKFPVFIEGKPKYLAGYTIDNTEQKFAEMALRESEERFRKIYTEGSTPIAMLDKYFRFININQAFQDTFGYSETELKDMTFKDITHPECITKDLENIRLLIEGKMEVYRTEKRYLTKNHQVVWGKAQVSIVRDSRGKFLYILVIIININDYKLAEAEIRTKNEQLEKINAEKDKFFSIIAHDLRSPFNAFLGFTEMMAEELYTMTLDEIQHIATDMKVSASNLYRLLENLLEWSMLQRGIKTFNPRTLLLDEITNESILALSDSLRKKGITMRVDIPAGKVIVADLNMLETVIRNLLSNAIKFTPRGGRIVVRAKADDKQIVHFSIEDNGIGMNKDVVDKLFSYDTRANRRGTDGEPSTGLGLLLCKELIEKHGGNLMVRSEEGSGSIFTFTIPHNSEVTK